MRLVFMCLFLFCSNVLAQERPLTVLVTHFPPFVNMNSPSAGVSWKLLRDFAASKGVIIEAQYLPTARLLKHIATGDWQATIVAVNKDTEGLVKVKYADKMVRYGLLVKHQKPLVLNGLHISTLRSAGLSTIQEYLTKQGAIISEVNTLQQAYLMYEAGRVDAVLGVTMDGKALGMPNLAEYKMATELAEIPFVLSINKENPLALSAYNKLIMP